MNYKLQIDQIYYTCIPFYNELKDWKKTQIENELERMNEGRKRENSGPINQYTHQNEIKHVVGYENEKKLVCFIDFSHNKSNRIFFEPEICFCITYLNIKFKLVKCKIGS